VNVGWATVVIWGGKDEQKNAAKKKKKKESGGKRRDGALQAPCQLNTLPAGLRHGTDVREKGD
jgi:hypothetical protein